MASPAMPEWLGKMQHHLALMLHVCHQAWPQAEALCIAGCDAKHTKHALERASTPPASSQPFNSKGCKASDAEVSRNFAARCYMFRNLGGIDADADLVSQAAKPPTGTVLNGGAHLSMSTPRCFGSHLTNMPAVARQPGRQSEGSHKHKVRVTGSHAQTVFDPCL